MTETPASDEPVWSAQQEYDQLRDVSPETPCPYLPGLMSRCEAYLADELSEMMYERLMFLGFRRSGRIVYRPRCRGCRRCRALRVVVDCFAASRSMRRVARRNEDVQVQVDRPVPTDEKFTLYSRYLDEQHDSTMSRGYESFIEFLYDSPMETLEFCYRVGDRLIGVGIADRCPSGLSSVYMYFEPDARHRSLGTLSVMREIEYCHRRGLPYYYLGYWVPGSKTMDYKVRFRPNEILAGDNCWATFRE